MRYGGPDETPLDPVDVRAAGRRFFVRATVDGRPASVAPAPGGAGDVEVFGTRPPPRSSGCTSCRAARGPGLARAMLAHLERTAADAGIAALVLETGTAQPEAIALYESSGYARDPGLRLLPRAPLSRCFGKLL